MNKFLHNHSGLEKYLESQLCTNKEEHVIVDKKDFNLVHEFLDIHREELNRFLEAKKKNEPTFDFDNYKGI